MTVFFAWVPLFVACTPDLVHDSRFRAATQDPAVSYRLVTPEPLRLGAPLRVEVEVRTTRTLQRQGATGGAHGRPDLDRWTVAPEALPDPSPYWEDFHRFVASARKPVQPGSPDRFPLYLDEELLFTAPGRYAVQLETARFDDTTVVLPPIEVEIAPRDPAADAAALREALAGIEHPDPKAREPHFRSLRALGTPATLTAAIEAVQEPDSPAWWVAILHTHPDRSGVRSALEKVLRDPEGGVTEALVEALVAVRYDALYDRALPRDADEADRRARTESLRAVQQEVAAELVEALPVKTRNDGEALEALSRLAFSLEDAPWRDRWLDLLRTRIDRAPPTFQRHVLAARWPLLDDPRSVAALKRIAAVPSPEGDLAFRRLMNLDRAAGSEVALARLAPDTTVDRAVLTDDGERAMERVDPLPTEAIDRLVDQLRRHPDDARLARLVARFGSSAHQDAVADALGAAEPNGELQGAYLAYFLNTQTRPDLVEQLIQAREKHPTLLAFAFRSVTDPRPLVRQAMRDLLADDNPPLQLAAAEVVAEGAEPSVVPLLEMALREAPPGRQTALVTALFTARRWMISKRHRARMLPRLTGERARYIAENATVLTDIISRLSGWIEDGEPVLEINQRPYVGRDAIRDKLRQFRPGAPIKITYRGVSPQVADPIFHPIVREAGLTVYVPRGTAPAESPE